MAAVISKALLLVALALGSFENAASYRPEGVRGLSFQHQPDPHHGIDISEEVVHDKDHNPSHKESDDGYYIEIVADDYYYYEDKGGKPGKSGKAHDDDYYYYKAKAGKSKKSAKAHRDYYNDDYYYYEDKSGKAFANDDYYYEDKSVKAYEDGYYYYESKSAKSDDDHHSVAYEDDYYYKSKSTKYDDDTDDYYYYKQKSMKYEKKDENKEKYHHDKNSYEVEYEVAVKYVDDTVSYDDQDEHYYSNSKSSKVRPMIPDFEYIEIGHKSGKDSKSGKKSKYGYEYDDDSYGKGYESKVSKSRNKEGKSGGGSGGGHKLPKAPTVSPSPHDGTPTSEPAPTVSPAPITPPSTPPPTEVGSFGVGVPEYSLAYQLLNKDEPKTQELNALEEATRAYLFDFFFNEFDEDDFTVFEQFLTEIVDFSYSNNMPVVVDYESVARFNEFSTITPTPTQLGSAVTEAFTGLNMIKYEEWLKETLPSNNIFVGSEVQLYQGDEGASDTSRRGMGATGIAASAVAFTLLVAGIVLYKSKSDGRESGSDKLNKSPGDMTVAGETFAGETYDGSASVSGASLDYARRYNDEEVGSKIDKSIPEDRDAQSVKPTWSDDADEDEGEDFGRGIAVANQARSAFRGSIVSAPRTQGEALQSRAMSTSFEDVALQAPAYGDRFQDNIMPDPSSSEDDASQMSDSELSQFVASTRQGGNQYSGGHTLEIKSLLSMDSMDDNTPSVSGGLSVRDNSSRRLRTVAEIEALLSSDLKDDSATPVSGTYKSKTQVEPQQHTHRPRTVEEIESLLSADDHDTIVDFPFSDEDESIIE